MKKRTFKNQSRAVIWLSERVIDPNCPSNSYYEKFVFQDLVAEIGDYVLIFNANKPDTEEGHDPARIVSLYEDHTNAKDPFRAKVQWYSRPSKLPMLCLNKINSADFLDKEVIEDHRPFNKDVSIETFFKKCSISLTLTEDYDHFTTAAPYHYICRYQLRSLTKRKVILEPLEVTETPKADICETPKSAKKLTKKKTEEDLSMELKENTDHYELQTLLKRLHVAIIPNKKQSVAKINEKTPINTLTCDKEPNSPDTTRLGRDARYDTNYMSPVKEEDSEEDFNPDPNIPVVPIKKAKIQNTPVKITPSTSQASQSNHKLKTPVSEKTCQLTPTLASRARPLDIIAEFVKENLTLPGRESQMDEILSFVRSNLIDETSGCMYMFGEPGSGKTVAAHSALSILKDEADVPEFQLVEVNGMRIGEPGDVYVYILKELTGTLVASGEACSRLNEVFSSRRALPVVLLVDEADVLCTERQDVLHNIVEWTTHGAAKLTVLALAPEPNLPECTLAARLGLTRLAFPPYTHVQLQSIIAVVFAGADLRPDAVQLIARKVAATSGDVRRALSLCQHSLESAGPGGAGLAEAYAALALLHPSFAVTTAIRLCAPAERLMLRAVAAEAERTGSDVTTLSRALAVAVGLQTAEGCRYRSTAAQARAACARLAALGLLRVGRAPDTVALAVCAAAVRAATGPDAGGRRPGRVASPGTGV